MFVVGKVITQAASSLGLPIDMRMNDDMVGMMPVYNTREAAEKDYPNSEIMALEELESGAS